VDSLKSLDPIVQSEVEDYARGKAWGATVYPLSDRERHFYSVIVVPDLPRPFPARVVVMARVVGEMVIIDEDTTDRPLYEELIRAGVERSRIICLYAGEAIPTR
jgi:hypothetical protein